MEELWRSDTFGKCRTTNNKGGSKWIPLLSSSWNPRAGGKKCSMFFQSMNNSLTCSPSFVKMHAMADWCLEGQCNWVLAGFYLLGNGSMFATVIFVTQKDFIVAKPVTFETRKTSHSVSNTEMSTVVDSWKMGTGWNNHSEIIVRLKGLSFKHHRAMNGLSQWSCSLCFRSHSQLHAAAPGSPPPITSAVLNPEQLQWSSCDKPVILVMICWKTKNSIFFKLHDMQWPTRTPHIARKIVIVKLSHIRTIHLIYTQKQSSWIFAFGCLLYISSALKGPHWC